MPASDDEYRHPMPARKLPRMTIGAVLLAAGTATRMGGRPKALLELGGVPLVLRQLTALSGAGVDEVRLVIGDVERHRDRTVALRYVRRDLEREVGLHELGLRTGG